MKTLFSLLLVSSVFLVGCASSTPTATSSPEEPSLSDTPAAQATESPIETPAEKTAGAASYKPYRAEDVQSLHGTQPYVVFFHAPWCPTCVKWEQRTTQGLDQLPPHAIILKADYDTETDLKVQYGINKQSTAVFIDREGNATKKVMDPSLEELASHFEA